MKNLNEFRLLLCSSSHFFKHQICLCVETPIDEYQKHPKTFDCNLWKEPNPCMYTRGFNNSFEFTLAGLGLMNNCTYISRNVTGYSLSSQLSTLHFLCHWSLGWLLASYWLFPCYCYYCVGTESPKVRCFLLFENHKIILKVTEEFWCHDTKQWFSLQNLIT